MKVSIQYSKKCKFIVMKTFKLLFLAAVAGIWSACEAISPEEKALIGKWSEQYHVDMYVESITFDEEGLAHYQKKPDTTWFTVIDEAGSFATLKYSVKNNKLHFSGENSVWSEETSHYEDVPFSFATDYSISGNVLTIDSFSYKGGHNSFFDSLVLYKQ
ncbi:MAG: hypothetical protein IJ000_05710 [Paludibacteraceae bacterium]|nr:hypothetical protein [Paludibacteraceae bacterium]